MKCKHNLWKNGRRVYEGLKSSNLFFLMKKGVWLLNHKHLMHPAQDELRVSVTASGGMVRKGSSKVKKKSPLRWWKGRNGGCQSEKEDEPLLKKGPLSARLHFLRLWIGETSHTPRLYLKGVFSLPLSRSRTLLYNLSLKLHCIKSYKAIRQLERVCDGVGEETH